MDGPGAGFEYPPVDVSWLKRDVLLFANSIGCTVDELHFLYELHPNFTPFPTYPVILPFKHADLDVIDFHARSAAVPIPGVPEFDSRRVVDGERRLEFLKPIPVSSEGRNFEIRSRVIGVFDKGKPGTVVETEQVLRDRDSGEAYTRAVGSAFYVAQGGWGGPKGPKTINYPPPSNKTPDATYTQPTSKETAHLYRLNGDYNPLHADPAPGKAMGFGGTIMHGLYSWNSTCHALLRTLGSSDPANLKLFQARFASPVKPSNTLVTEMWRMGPAEGYGVGWEEVRFVTKVKETGRVVLSNGKAVIRVSAGREKSKL